MEIKIYKNMDFYSKRKYFFCAAVECPDAFDFKETDRVFRSIYGTGIVIEYISLCYI